MYIEKAKREFIAEMIVLNIKVAEVDQMKNRIKNLE